MQITPSINTPHPYILGASLYMPATRDDIWQVIKRNKLPKLNSIIICLEDAVSQADVSLGLNNMQNLLATWANDEILAQTDLQTQGFFQTSVGNQACIGIRPLVFIRPRHPQMLMQIANSKHSHLIDGYVLPKVDMDSLSSWRMASSEHLDDASLLMPTLETGRLFDMYHNHELAIALAHAFEKRIFALRIGGNDLFAALRQRRPINSTIYDTPIGTLIHQLLGTFVVQGYYLTAPVFEYFDRTALFIQEVSRDVSLGMVGKTVIHPTQIPLVQQAYCVPVAQLNEAKAILESDAKAVFKHNNTMLEPATHHAWASEVLQRAAVFGVLQ